ncbi:TonB-dependent receptor [Chitinophaga horti]|uniref:TonB-dependent receptor n=1 Tax=Chitinophaga horti TaxID=2920382 RepID=A0ABY6IVK5_9BACT|nr:TonB-dependent receptor [Chitinophaga horti]UYQ91258.1 TonB-dependent receptor [Chitinophaga horti]
MSKHLPRSFAIRRLPLCRLLIPSVALFALSPNVRAAMTTTIVFQDQQPTAAKDGVATGKVVDEANQPLPGVTVSVKGARLGTVTDAQGNFSLRSTSSLAGQTLEFSFMGYLAQQVAYTGEALRVTLKSDQKALGEVIVVGYGTQKKVNMVGAVSAITVDQKITSRSLPNASSALSGLVPGLAVTQSTGMAGRNNAALMIRGLGTVNNANPLVVVDGMPDVNINRVNINDIESISVLKDATSASIYGSRAANGVILITTKSGKGQRRTQLNFNGNYAIEQPVKSYNFMNDYARALTVHQRAALNNTLRSQLLFKDGTIDQWMALAMIDPLKYPSTDWWDIIMRNGTMQNYNVSATGGTEASNFFFSVGTLDQKGLQINNDYKQYNARFNFDYKLKKNMNTGVRFFGNWSQFKYALEDGYTDDDAANTAGFDMQYAIAGITPYDPVSGYFGGVMAYNEDPQAYNPYTVYTNALNRQNRQEANTMAYIDWTPIKGLTARLDYTLNYYNQFRYKADMPNRAYNFQQGIFGSRIYVGDNAPIQNFTNTGYKTMMNARLNYNTQIGKNHELGALFVYSEEYWFDRWQNGSRNDRLYPTLHELDAALPDIQSASGNTNTEGMRSYIGRVNYTAFQRYLLEANFRVDGSSRFLPGSQYGLFSSVAAGWRFSEEAFMASTRSWLSNGKVRVSYGGLGNNSGVGRYEQLNTLASSSYMINATSVKGLVNSKMVNTSLTWENTDVLNIGLDLGFFNGRLTTEMDYYDRLTTGMNRPSDFSIHLSGAYNPPPRRNIGNLRNRGVEMNLTWADKMGDFNYLFNFNGSHNWTRLESWNEFLGRGYTFLGMPYHFVYVYEDMGIAQTWQDVYNATPQGAQPGDILRKDLNGDGKIDGNDQKAYPKLQRDRPTTFLSLRSSLSWKGIDLSFLLTGALGRKDYVTNNYNNTNMGTQRYASTWDHYYNTWNLDNRAAEWPRLGGSGGNRSETQYWLDNMNYMRLKNIQLGYNLPQQWMEKLKINNFRVFGSTENLATITKYRGLDPEIQANRSNAYPLTKSYSVGVNVGF